MHKNTRYLSLRRKVLNKINYLSKVKSKKLINHILKLPLIKENSIKIESLKEKSLSTIISEIINYLSDEDKVKLGESIEEFLGSVKQTPIIESDRSLTEIIEIGRRATVKISSPHIKKVESFLLKNEDLRENTIQQNAIKSILMFNGLSEQISNIIVEIVFEIDETEILEIMHEKLSLFVKGSISGIVDPMVFKETIELYTMYGVQAKKLINSSNFIALSVAYFIYEKSSDTLNMYIEELLNQEKMEEDEEIKIALSYGIDEVCIHNLIISSTLNVLNQWNFPYSNVLLIKELENFYYYEDENEPRLKLDPFPWFR